MPTMTIVLILVGLALIFAGRKLFWLAIAAIGFIAGMELARFYADVPTESTRMLIAIGVGLLSALAAILLQKMAVGLAGFVAGGYGAFLGIKRLGLNLGSFSWAPIVFFGIVGAVIAALVFEWALIVLSSLVGSYLLVTSSGISASAKGPLFLILSFIGVLVQSKSKKKKHPGAKRAEKEPISR